MPNPHWRTVIISVLKKAGKPLHYAAITQAVIDGKLRDKVGATPANSVSAAITLSIKEKGDNSPFVKVSPGVYGLRDLAEGEPIIDTHDEAKEDAERMGLINAFGMFWRRSEVNWQVSEPKLLGQQLSGGDPVNFAAQIGVYILYDGPRIIYVGQVISERLSRRLKEHVRDRLNGRWDRFSWFGVRGVADDGGLQKAPSNFALDNLVDTMEALLIEGLEPPQNRRRGDNFNAVEFIQV
ncbi:HTH domain-containing protein [Actinoplanes sp. NPDC051346]|uniref:HTH domain-containing protein n=1 Tax=Actinoplanes sp. NPDC051346 TaxID=3155048 RepID=UPI0034310801